LTRVVVAIAAVAVLVLVAMHVFRSRETRLWEFIDREQALVLDRRPAPEGRPEFLDGFDPSVRYQKTGGFSDVKRDHARFLETGIDAVQVTKREATMTDDGADVRLEAVLLAALHPVAQVVVRFHAEDGDGQWRILQVSWE
jgi:hypothetical protein